MPNKPENNNKSNKILQSADKAMLNIENIAIAAKENVINSVNGLRIIRHNAKIDSKLRVNVAKELANSKFQNEQSIQGGELNEKKYAGKIMLTLISLCMLSLITEEMNTPFASQNYTNSRINLQLKNPEKKLVEKNEANPENLSESTNNKTSKIVNHSSQH